MLARILMMSCSVVYEVVAPLELQDVHRPRPCQEIFRYLKPGGKDQQLLLKLEREDGIIFHPQTQDSGIDAALVLVA